MVVASIPTMGIYLFLYILAICIDTKNITSATCCRCRSRSWTRYGGGATCVSRRLSPTKQTKKKKKNIYKVDDNFDQTKHQVNIGQGKEESRTKLTS